MEDISYQIITKVFSNKLEDIYYSALYGFTTEVTYYREITDLYSKICFGILDEYKLNYYVFAGTSIGYIRDKRTIPWVDDYDIMIFEYEIEKFEKIIIPVLEKNGFWCFKHNACNKGGYHILSHYDQRVFQLDVFFSNIDSKGFIRNLGGWGLYNSKNIHISLVDPPQRLTIDNDKTLPFFNKYTEDILHEYGDVLNTVIFHVNHRAVLRIPEKFDIVYEEFTKITDIIQKNTKEQLKIIDYVPSTNMTLLTSPIIKNTMTLLTSPITENSLKSISSLEFTKYIREHNVRRLSLLHYSLLEYCVDLKYYLKDITINYYMTNKIDSKYLIFLNYIDNVYCSTDDEVTYLYENSIILKKHTPQIHKIRVITFGTYDLFHEGHYNILKRAREYGDLVVGVSTDEFNLVKGKKSVNSFDKRIRDVLDTKFTTEVFGEEGFEYKHDYIKRYNSNLLVMGDDWKDKFNEYDCACIYLPRTPDISTTELKQLLYNTNKKIE